MVAVVGAAGGVEGDRDALLGEVAQYGQDGVLVQAGAVCQVRDEGPWPPDQAAVDAAAFGVRIQYVVHDAPQVVLSPAARPCRVAGGTYPGGWRTCASGPGASPGALARGRAAWRELSMFRQAM